MNSSELRQRVPEWLNTFEEISGKIQSKDSLAKYLVSRIEAEVFIERDPDVIKIRKDGRSEYARILNEDKARGIVSLELIDSKSQMVLTYAALREMCEGGVLVSALDYVSNR